MSLEIDFFKLLQIRGSLKLEQAGLTHSSGLRIRPRVCKELGLKPRDSYDKFIVEVQKRIDAMYDKEKSKLEIAKGINYDKDKCLACGEKHGNLNMPCPKMTPMC